MNNLPPLVFDTEVYRDYFLVMFRSTETGNTRHFEMYPGKPLDVAGVRKCMTDRTVVSFNGNNYDLLMLSIAMSGGDNALIKRASDAVIVNNMKPWVVADQLGVNIIKPDHIDLIEVAPGVASLKIYGGRMHSRRMQDLPIDPSASITPEMREVLVRYCGNDMDLTIDLYRKLKPQLDLRENMTQEYGIDLRSKSDAQIAEAVIRKQVGDLLKRKIQRPEIAPGTSFNYKVPAHVTFDLPVLREVLDLIRTLPFTVSGSGSVELPQVLKDTHITIGSSVYRMGIGGLHSSEQSIAHYADDEYLLVDRDVASYYPAIILGLGLYPKHLGTAFLKIYGKIVSERLNAKKKQAMLKRKMQELDSSPEELEQCKRDLLAAQVETDSKKTLINGSFGKFGSKWSSLYSPDLLIQTTITGQLSLLMLIEWLEREGISVVSANTDGIVIKCPRRLEPMMDGIVSAWELWTGFETEATHYRALYSRDVNNYFAIKDGGGYKVKGAYAPAGLQKNPTNEICSEAVAQFLMNGTPIADTIMACRDIRKFVTIRQVKGGAVKGDDYLGKAVRWYYAKGEVGTINYKVNGYTVARSEGAKPVMDLPDTLPDDVDHDWYIREAESILRDVGAV